MKSLQLEITPNEPNILHLSKHIEHSTPGFEMRVGSVTNNKVCRVCDDYVLKFPDKYSGLLAGPGC